MRVRLNHDALAVQISQSDLSQNHWAIKLGLSSGHLADLVNGRHPYPSAVTRDKLINGLTLAFDDLFSIETPVGATIGAGDFRSQLEAALAARYLIDDVIGKGGMGTVYRARDIKHGRPVAIKVVMPDAIATLGNKQFLAEIRRTASLQHPNILPLLDSGEAAECPYLVTPLVKDGSLAELIRTHGPMRPSDALKWLRGVCHALAYAHSNRLVHCDIKPENVLISSEQAIVTDFGVSRAIHLDGRPRSHVIDTSTGTPAYVSPEQVSGDTVDSRSDMYSTACMAFEMISGAPPFAGRNDMEIVAQRFLEDAPDIRDIAPATSFAISAVLQRAMSRNPRRRFENMREFLEAFEGSVLGERISLLGRVDNLFRGMTTAAKRTTQSALDALHPMFNAKTSYQVASRRRNGVSAMTNVIQDIRFAARLLLKQPLFTTVAVVTLALGIGANTAIFSLVNGFLLTPLPYENADRIVTLWEIDERGNTGHIAGANFVDWQSESESFEAMAVHPSFAFGGPTTVLGGNEPTRVLVAGVSNGFFDIFRVQPAIGRLLSSSDFAPDAPPATVVSHRFWQNQLGGTPEFQDRTLNVYGRTVSVIGVAPPGFNYPDNSDLWGPITPGDNPSRTSHNWAAIGILNSDVTLEEAQTEMTGIAARLRVAYGDNIDAVDVRVTPLQDELVGSFRRPLNILLAASAMVLLVACTNIASTLLAQGKSRAREFAIRNAMGATRWRIVRQLLAESTLLSIAGATVGLALSFAILQTLGAVAPPGLSFSASTSLNIQVVLFAGVAAFGATILFGLVPAIRSTSSQRNFTLRGGDHSVAGDQSGWSWRALVAGEIALALILLVGAGLLIKSFWQLMTVDPGFEPRGVMTADVSLPSSQFPDDASVSAYYRELEMNLGTLPGITNVGLVNHVPFGGARINGGFEVDGWSASEVPYADYRVVNGDYFAAMGIPIIRGRSFESRDNADAPHVAVVNQRLAERYWPGQDPIGQRIRNLSNDSWIYSDTWITVIGVVGDVHHRALNVPAEREIYVNVLQRPFRARSAIVSLRTTAATSNLVDEIRTTLRRVGPDVPFEISDMETYIRSSVADRRFTMLILGAFAGTALALAIVGIYGVVSYLVTQRTREMGIRIALGAEPGKIRQLVQRDAMTTVTVGAAVGVVGSIAIARVMENLLFGVSSADPLTLGAVVLGLLAAAWFASLVPAIRSTRVDPMITIRGE